MTYLLTHTGCKLPSHILHTIRQILFVDSLAKIVLCTDQNVIFSDSRVEVIDVRDLNLPSLGNYFINEQDPLWRNSLQRIFIINEYLRNHDESIIHFDNDVLIYKNISEFASSLDSGVYITQQTDDTFIFGYSIIKSKNKFNSISESILNEVSLGMDSVLSKTKNHAHEMRLLYCFGKDNIIPLPTHPEIFSNSSDLFDPITYGQNLGGVNYGPGPGFIDHDHIVGKILDKKDTKVIFDKGPFIVYKNKQYDLCNLHLHGKKLEYFKTYE